MTQGQQVGGSKADTDKRPWHLAPWAAMGKVVDVMAFGAQKYGERNWEKGIKYSRLYSALQRHLTDWWDGQDADPETGLPPLAHAACDALFLLTFVLLGRAELDDRPVTEAGRK
jgi:hypothetical protein